MMAILLCNMCNLSQVYIDHSLSPFSYLLTSTYSYLVYQTNVIYSVKVIEKETEELSVDLSPDILS